MEDDEGGPRLSKRFSDKDGGEVDFKTKAGTAWSHNFLNQKPWHPLSYPNQRRKWIAEQTHSQRQRRAEEIAREYSQEQEYLRQTSLLSQKEKEKVDIMQAVSFMYVRPPGYNAESAKAAEIADERRKIGESDPTAASSSSVAQEAVAVKEEKKKARPKDVFGRTLPTEEEFAVLKNAPRLETGVTGRVKPFAVEVRNVKCVRCGNYGHQSGDRECPLKDAIMPNDENRLKRDDPLTAIMAQMDPSEPLKWELKQKPGISPPRGGFHLDDPNQQIVADEEIFDEYGGFLNGGNIPELLTNFNSLTHKKKSKGKSNKKNISRRKDHEDSTSSSDRDNDRRSSKMKHSSKRKQKWASHRQSHEGNSPVSHGDSGKLKGKISSKHKKRRLHLDTDQESSFSSDSYEHKRRSRKRRVHNKTNRKDLSHSSMSEDSVDERYHGRSKHKDLRRHKKSKSLHEGGSSGEEKSSKKGKRCRSKKPQNDSEYCLSEDSESERHTRKHKRYINGR
ncbi:uncharacterized zinc finger CCHC domain-containing protein At4g19190-like [Chenopodium quinoa]|uniref:uncharacterized zinc finger CCHC domain-containing protein At4g19190-like n=1 Tax=Chenopodium quinoa TaxID=63459 RepID=UPI000B771BD5|nr:uncharacterized zinc finger CCHC domain-containing protein At4g19190-like [Chenopodium quinoa]